MYLNRSIRILLVEDDPVHARLIRRALGQQVDIKSLHIDHIADGDLALDHILGPQRDGIGTDKDRPDLVLLDLRLPTIDGFEVLEALREVEATRCMPVVVVSTSDQPLDVSRSYQLGANAYVSKPPDFEQLTEKMSGLSRFWVHAAELPNP